jgi:serine phosphatase RsbU (regulator of sigma subunit)/anti-sigma regulatory factor (Ser/Thr protein kinase)
MNSKKLNEISNLQSQLAAGEAVHRDELIIARAIQAAMIPSNLPAMEGLECASLFLPAPDIGGDLYDVTQVSTDLIAITIFDVASSGIPAALLAALAKISFSKNMRFTTSPRMVIERVNEDLIKSVHSDFFITAIVAYLDLHDNNLCYCNAGHPHPIIYRHDTKSLEPIESTGTILGVFEKSYFEEKSVYLNSGDWLLFFTDGIYKLFSAANDLTGRQLFEKATLSTIYNSSPQAFCADISARFKSAEVMSCDDDITLIGFEFLTQSRKNQLKIKLGFHENDPVYLQFISYFEEMDRTAAVLLSAMDAFGYADESIRKMKIILTELLANAIYHGNNADHTKKVTIGHLIDKQKITISIMDEGEGFDSAVIPDPTLPENISKDCGRGLYIVKNYADSVSFNEKGNRITITKNHVII